MPPLELPPVPFVLAVPLLLPVPLVLLVLLLPLRNAKGLVVLLPTALVLMVDPPVLYR
jgi:hypothetical protein